MLTGAMRALRAAQPNRHLGATGAAVRRWASEAPEPKEPRWGVGVLLSKWNKPKPVFPDWKGKRQGSRPSKKEEREAKPQDSEHSPHEEGHKPHLHDEDFSKDKPEDDAHDKKSKHHKKHGDTSNSDDPEAKNRKQQDRVLQQTVALFLTGIVLSVYLRDLLSEGNWNKISYKDFQARLSKREIESIEVQTDYYEPKKKYKVLVKVGQPHNAPHGKVASSMDRMQSKNPTLGHHHGRVFQLEVVDPTTFLANLEQEMKDLRYEVKDYIPVRFVNSYSGASAFYRAIQDSVILTLGVYVLYMTKDMKMVIDKVMPKSKKAMKTFEVSKLKGGFGTVAGLETAKLEIQEFVDFLKDPFIYASVGARMPKGALLTGPPGTGKTLLAKACAVESGVSFFAVSGSDFVEKYVGIGSQNVRNLFREAKLRAPAVIFIDEIDAIGKKRNETAMFTNTERENTLNQLLVELDGFDSKTSIVVLAATNRPEILDPALLRPGRLDRHIALTLPDIKAREEIFRLYLSKLKIDQGNLDYLGKRLASLSPQFSGADISNLCNEAAILAAREFADQIELKHFEEAAERVIGGLRRDNLVTKEERKLVATHESGHAVASWFLKGADPLVKVTIVPRSKGALGYAQYLTQDDDIYTKSSLMDRITFILGGRVAEEIFFNKISTGAQDDLEKAFKLAHTLVTRLGMTEEFAYSNFASEERRNYYSPAKENVKFSDQTQERIDEAIVKIIEECHRRCTQILTEKKELIAKLRDTLLEKESVTLADLNSILGERSIPEAPQFGFRLNSEGQGAPAN